MPQSSEHKLELHSHAAACSGVRLLSFGSEKPRSGSIPGAALVRNTNLRPACASCVRRVARVLLNVECACTGIGGWVGRQPSRAPSSSLIMELPPPSARPVTASPPINRVIHYTNVNPTYTWPGSNWRPSACKADVIATRPQVLQQFGNTMHNNNLFEHMLNKLVVAIFKSH